MILYECRINNVTLSLTLAVYLRKRVKLHNITENRAKSLYSWLAVVAGIFSGLALFLAIIELFNIPLGGHGEILIASPLFNLLLSVVNIVIGRVIIGWVPLKW